MGQTRVEASDAVVAPSRARRFSLNAALDGFFFVFAGIASVWLAWLVLTESFGFGWWGLAFFVLFWLVLAYLVLPRLHRILTTIYVPDYFIGRARTSDGLLGDPVNLAVDGPEASLHAAMLAAGWTRADDVTLASSWRIVTGTLTRKSYDEAPVSPLFLFGRQQDFAYQQEVEGNPAKRPATPSSPCTTNSSSSTPASPSHMSGVYSRLGDARSSSVLNAALPPSASGKNTRL
jgi:hypothetical protein